MRDFRSEGGVVKTDDEKRQMAEKHRFKKNREFKKRLDEDEENAEADIRSFKFHSLERSKYGERRERKSFDRDNSRGRGEKRFDKGDKRFDKGGKRFDKGGKRGGFRKNDYNDED